MYDGDGIRESLVAARVCRQWPEPEYALPTVGPTWYDTLNYVATCEQQLLPRSASLPYLALHRMMVRWRFQEAGHLTMATHKPRSETVKTILTQIFIYVDCSTWKLDGHSLK